MKKRLRIAVVIDNITAHSLTPDAELIHLTPLNWRWQLRHNKPDFLFVVSTQKPVHEEAKPEFVVYPSNP